MLMLVGKKAMEVDLPLCQTLLLITNTTLSIMKFKFKATSIALVSLLTTANAMTAGLLTIQPAQAERYCGPDNSDTNKELVQIFLFPYAKVFDPACKKHDKCYDELRSNGKTKEQCELEFKRDLYAQCEKRSLIEQLSQELFGVITSPKLWGSSGSLNAACKRRADWAAWGVSQFGEGALRDAGQALYSLKIVKIEASRINDRLSDDELKVCVSVRNDGNLATEWDLVLLNKKGGIVDTAPNTHERNIKVGQTDRECVGTRGTTSSISDLGSQAKVVVRIDDTPGLASFFPIATFSVDTNRPKDKFTAVPYNKPSKREAYDQIVRMRSR
jgi:hypothetical protein